MKVIAFGGGALAASISSAAVTFATSGSISKRDPMWKVYGFPSKQIMDWDVISLRCLKVIFGL